jgi:hypothetical protein
MLDVLSPFKRIPRRWVDPLAWMSMSVGSAGGGLIVFRATTYSWLSPEASKLHRIAQLRVTLISLDHERRQQPVHLTEGVVLVLDLARVLRLLRLL